MSAVVHAIYTNAPSRGAGGSPTGGFRSLFPGRSWPAADRERIGRWLSTLRPARGEGEPRATVFGSFRVGRVLHAAVARAEPAFALDEHGRGGGILVHAALAPLAEGTPPGDFGTALWSATETLRPRPDLPAAERLDAFLDECSETEAVPHLVVDPKGAMAVGEATLGRFLALAWRRGDAPAVFPADGEETLAPRLLRCASLLPPRLRLAARFGVGLAHGADLVFLARAAAAGETPPKLPAGPWEAVLRWWTTAVDGWRYDEVVALADDWEVRGFEQLLQRIPPASGAAEATR